MAGDSWRDAHDYVADTLFGIALASGLQGSTETRGIYSRAVPAEVLATMLEAEAADGGGRRARPGGIPDATLMVDGRRRLYDVKLIHFCRSRYWPTHEVADARGGPLERRAMEVQREYRSGAESLDARTAAHYASSGGQAPGGSRRRCRSWRPSHQCAASSLAARRQEARARSGSSSTRRRLPRLRGSGARSAHARSPRPALG